VGDKFPIPVTGIRNTFGALEPGAVHEPDAPFKLNGRLPIAENVWASKQDPPTKLKMKTVQNRKLERCLMNGIY
jgi:hypothetical protein